MFPQGAGERARYVITVIHQTKTSKACHERIVKAIDFRSRIIFEQHYSLPRCPRHRAFDDGPLIRHTAVEIHHRSITGHQDLIHVEPKDGLTGQPLGNIERVARPRQVGDNCPKQKAIAVREKSRESRLL
jgi:hypothetical protein